jgi:hypothetical protein
MADSVSAANIMNRGIARRVFRWIHIVFSIPIIGYIYSPFDQIPNYARPTRLFFVPSMILSGLWMWKGHLVLRLLSKCFSPLAMQHEYFVYIPASRSVRDGPPTRSCAANCIRKEN